MDSDGTRDCNLSNRSTIRTTSKMALSDSEEPERLYFAYGSNLSTTQMQYRCPRSTPVGLAHLKGWTVSYFLWLAVLMP